MFCRQGDHLQSSFPLYYYKSHNITTLETKPSWKAEKSLECCHYGWNYSTSNSISKSIQYKEFACLAVFLTPDFTDRVCVAFPRPLELITAILDASPVRLHRADWVRRRNDIWNPVNSKHKTTCAGFTTLSLRSTTIKEKLQNKCKS